jgi:hypothetical protein
MNFRLIAPAILALSGVSLAQAQTTLWNNGSFITNPTGGTGAIAGLPISNADGYNVPGSTFLFSTTGTNASTRVNTAVAENFVVPAGQRWNIDSLKLFAFQTSQTTATVTSINVNLWTATPYSAGSPDAPAELPSPVLATPLTIAAGPGTFVAHRQSPTSTSTNRPVFSYTVSVDDLPAGGILGPGEYWIEWAFTGAATPSANVFMPLISPRTSVPVHNARLFNSIDGSSAGPRIWFEGREGFVANVTDGRAYTLPFELSGFAGTIADCPGDINVDNAVDFGDFLAFFNCYDVNASCAETDGNDGIDFGDFLAFFNSYDTGC